MSREDAVASRRVREALADETAFLPIAIWLAEVSAEAARDAATQASEREAMGSVARCRGEALPPRPEVLS